MGHEQDEFAEFYRASRDSCLKAVTAVVGDRELAEELVAEDLGGDHAWGHDPATTPLYGWLKERGCLTPANPPLKP